MMNQPGLNRNRESIALCSLQKIHSLLFTRYNCSLLDNKKCVFKEQDDSSLAPRSNSKENTAIDEININDLVRYKYGPNRDDSMICLVISESKKKRHFNLVPTTLTSYLPWDVNDRKQWLSSKKSKTVSIDKYWLDGKQRVQNCKEDALEDDRIWIIELMKKIEPRIDITGNDYHATLPDLVKEQSNDASIEPQRVFFPETTSNKIGKSRFYREIEDYKYDEMLPLSENVYLDRMNEDEFKVYIKHIETMSQSKRHTFFQERRNIKV